MRRSAKVGSDSVIPAALRLRFGRWLSFSYERSELEKLVPLRACEAGEGGKTVILRIFSA